jgi:hypothetical protein
MQVGSLFTHPIIPSVYLQVSQARLESDTYYSEHGAKNEAPHSIESYFMMLMEDVSWGVT